MYNHIGLGLEPIAWRHALVIWNSGKWNSVKWNETRRIGAIFACFRVVRVWCVSWAFLFLLAINIQNREKLEKYLVFGCWHWYSWFGKVKWRLIITGNWFQCMMFLQEAAGLDDRCVSSVSATDNGLPATLWHALDVWQCTVQLSGRLGLAAASLAVCQRHLLFSDW